jgi:anaerobic magnesium-protoporphyrin IX monomethyl ester cyclase
LAPAVLVSYLRSQSDLASELAFELAEYRSQQSDTDILQTLTARKPWVVGWSVYTWNVGRVLFLCRLLKENRPQTQILLGGPQVSDRNAAEDILTTNPAIDGIVRGEGELPLAAYLRHLLRPDHDPLPCGLTLRAADGQTYSTEGAMVLAELGEANAPLLSGVLDPDNPPGQFFCLESYRGCLRGCKFCSWGARQIRVFPLELVLRQVEKALSNPQTMGGFFVDSDFFLFPQRAVAILRRIHDLSPEGVWFLESDPSHITDEAMDCLREMPNVMLCFGLQSSNPQVLAASGRPIHLEDFCAALVRLRQAVPKLQFLLSLICGLPGETLESHLNSMEYALSFQPNSIAFNLLQLLPGTPYFHDPERFGILHGGSPDYPFFGTEQMPPKDLETAIQLGAFIRSCFDFPVLRGFFPKAVANGRYAPGTRPIVTAYQRVRQQMLEAGLPQESRSTTGSRDLDLYHTVRRWLARAAHTTMLYRAVLGDPLMFWEPNKLAVMEFLCDVESRFVPDQLLSEVPSWHLKRSHVSSDPFLPGAVEERYGLK